LSLLKSKARGLVNAGHGHEPFTRNEREWVNTQLPDSSSTLVSDFPWFSAFVSIFYSLFHNQNDRSCFDSWLIDLCFNTSQCDLLLIFRCWSDECDDHFRLPPLIAFSEDWCLRFTTIALKAEIPFRRDGKTVRWKQDWKFVGHIWLRQEQITVRQSSPQQCHRDTEARLHLRKWTLNMLSEDQYGQQNL
jgi:hypothetical protein